MDAKLELLILAGIIVVPALILAALRTYWTIRVAWVSHKIRRGTATEKDVREAEGANHLYHYSLRKR